MFKTAKFQSCQRRYQPNLTFDFGGYDYWRLWMLAGTALAVLTFGACGCRPIDSGTNKKLDVFIYMTTDEYNTTFE